MDEDQVVGTGAAQAAEAEVQVVAADFDSLPLAEVFDVAPDRLEAHPLPLDEHDPLGASGEGLEAEATRAGEEVEDHRALDLGPEHVEEGRADLRAHRPEDLSGRGVEVAPAQLAGGDAQAAFAGLLLGAAGLAGLAALAGLDRSGRLGRLARLARLACLGRLGCLGRLARPPPARLARLARHRRGRIPGRSGSDSRGADSRAPGAPAGGSACWLRATGSASSLPGSGPGWSRRGLRRRPRPRGA